MYRTLLRGPWSRREFIRPIRPVTSVSRPLLSVPAVSKLNGRTFTSGSILQSEPPSQPAGGDEPPDASSHVPWYLQEEAPVPESSQMASRDQIPDLPEDPPAILPAFLEYVFKDLGLDDLKLIDLRGLETPPALGANVIMLIGTARSVKHLNVSADRLCRWLRSTYKLSPYADGLLGRNELKIKLRRKARRARLASRSGTMFDDKDDGITTGWICVNAGVVEEAPVLEEQEKSFEGFGQISAGTRIVAQMFTEEKRAEVDLESLWQGTLDRAERAKKKYAEVSSDAPPKEVRDPIPRKLPPSDCKFGPVPQSTINFDRTRNGGFGAVPKRNMSSAALAYETRADTSIDSLLQHLEDVSSENARRELGTGPEDRSSTLFLQNYYDHLSEMSPEDQAVAQIKLLCVAISLQHPAYSKQSLWAAFMNCNALGYVVSDDLGFQVVSALLSKRLAADHLSDSDKELALQVLEHLSARGTNVLTMKVFNMLFKASQVSPREDSQNGSSARRVSRMLSTLNLPFDPEHARHLMVTLFENKDYDGFWKLWRKFPLNASPRTVADYEMLFRLHVQLGNERRARDCLSTWVPMMNREETPIPLQGDILQLIMQCLVVAEPAIEQKVEEGSNSNLARIWNECQRNL